MRMQSARFFLHAFLLLAGVIAMPVLLAAEAEEPTETLEIDSLEWMVSTNGENMRWPDAVSYCENLALAGHDDWRLPMLDELEQLYDADSEEGIRSPFGIGDCCLWSSESLVDRPAEDGHEIGGEPRMYQWGYMFDGGFPYYAVHIFEDGRALCVRDTDSGGQPR